MKFRVAIACLISVHSWLITMDEGGQAIVNINIKAQSLHSESRLSQSTSNLDKQAPTRIDKRKSYSFPPSSDVQIEDKNLQINDYNGLLEFKEAIKSDIEGFRASGKRTIDIDPGAVLGSPQVRRCFNKDRDIQDLARFLPEIKKKEPEKFDKTVEYILDLSVGSSDETSYTEIPHVSSENEDENETKIPSITKSSKSGSSEYETKLRDLQIELLQILKEQKFAEYKKTVRNHRIALVASVLTTFIPIGVTIYQGIACPK